jgi:hypothetical protein
MGKTGDDIKDRGCAISMSILLNHHLGGLDDGGDGVTFFEFKFVSTAASYHTIDQVVPHSNDDVGHDVAKSDFFDHAAQFISG